VCGYGCEDHFYELDTVDHCWEAVQVRGSSSSRGAAAGEQTVLPSRCTAAAQQLRKVYTEPADIRPATLASVCSST
jgi:hypothetical protein